MRTVAFIPIKLNSERLPGKNIKCFDNGEPLVVYPLKTALKVEAFDEIYVYCSSEEIIRYLPDGVKFLKRPTSLDLSSTSISEVISMFVQAVDADIYALMHATAPFLHENSIERGVKALKQGEHDSALAVKKHYDFIWKNGKPDNYDVHNIPRTQDLEPFYIETTGLYIFSRELAKLQRRIGDTPYLIEVSDIEAIDINEPADFEIANAIFNHILLKKI